MTTSREQFEAEYSKLMGTPASVLENMRDGDEYRHTDGHRMQIAWLMWQACRSAIVVELPQRQEPTSSGHYGEGYLVPNTSGTALDYDDTVDALRAAGIAVKGDS